MSDSITHVTITGIFRTITMIKINETAVTQKIYNAMTDQRRKGGKVFLVIPEPTELDAVRGEGKRQPCRNCNGAGKVGIQSLVGGPYEEPHTKYETVYGDDGPQRHNIGCIYYSGKWFNAKTMLDDCPVCSGVGR